MRVALFISPGFEEIEAITPVDLLRRADIEIITVSLTDSLYVEGAHNLSLKADILISNILSSNDYNGVILPGGLRGMQNIVESEKARDLTQELFYSQKMVAAICASPFALFTFGILKGKKYTCYPRFEENIKEAQFEVKKVVIDGNLITSRGVGTAVDFSLAMIRYLKGDELANKIQKAILYE